ncbi:MAG: MotA/TolQ/ExbB proton channel family protein [Thermodesulfobacteriota bacterium]|nr:MotA/TolQ/ExbB proton channel family protein [Thermodesulfobacteriota bacterium]
MYPILLCSVLSLAIFLERLWVLRRKMIIPKDFISQVEELVGRDKVEDAVFLCHGSSSTIARIFLAGLKNTGRGMWLIKESIEEKGRREGILLERNIGALLTIANLSPLLGLLGTVSGMIKSFNTISTYNVSSTAPLAGGIAEALITTATGLLVAIPTLVVYRFLVDKAQMLIFQMEENSIKLIDAMEGNKNNAI